MKSKYLISVIGLIILISLLFVSCHKANTQTTSTVSVVRGDITEKVTVVGNIVPEQSVTVKSVISGTVARLFHDEGDYIKQGEPLLEVKPNPTPQDYAQTQQQVQIDLAKEKQYDADVARYRSLLQQGAISKNDQDYSQAISNYRQAKLQRTLDEEKLALLQKGKAQIGGQQIANIVTSPINGYILQRAVNVGDPVVAQTDSQAGNALWVIADMGNLIFKGQASETDVAKLHLGMPASVKIAALPDNTIVGTVNKIALQSVQSDITDNTSQTNQSSGNSNSGSGNNNSPFNVGFNVEVNRLQFPKMLALRSGYSANAEIVVKQVKNVLLLPMRVIQFENDKPYVWLLDKHAQPVKGFIMIGVSDGIQTQVVSGLKDGDKVLENAPGSSDNDSSDDD